MKFEKHLQLEKIIIDFLLLKKYRLIRHLVFLICFLFFLLSSEFHTKFSEGFQYYWVSSIYLIFILMFYINIYILVPILLKGKVVSYILLLIFMILACLVSFIYINFNFIPAYSENGIKIHTIFPSKFIFGLFQSVTFIMLSTTLKLFQNWVKNKEQIEELQQLTHEMELVNLKNQINPHFLFNMFNNVKALIRKNPDDAVNVIIKLSDFLRYQLYENNAKETNLSKEIVFLSNLLNLEEIRRDNLNITFNNSIPTTILESTYITPNLFSIFVENAVKHSVDIYGNESYINIHLSIVDDNLLFMCKNSVCPEFIISDKKNSGLGLVNIKRRLELLFDNSYTLDINKTEKEFCVNLIVPI